MSDFSDTWKSMSVEQRALHIVRDWQDSRESNDPMVMRVAAVVAHAVLSEAIVELNTLRAELDRLGPQMLRAAAEIKTLRAERDEARRDFCHCDDGWPFDEETARERANQLGWDCFKEDTNA